VPRARLIRYAGLTGSILLAVSAYLGGVLPRWRAGVTPVSIWQGEHGPVIILTWLAGTGLLAGAWWVARHGVPSTRWVYVTVGLWLLPLLVAPPLGSRDIYSYACQGAVYVAGHDPYAVGVAEGGCPWLESVSPIWRDTPAPYGPLFVLLAGAAAALGGSLAGTLALLRVLAVVGVVLLAACLPPLARRGGVPPERALWLVLACPLVTVHLVSGAHNDALMVGLLVAGLLVTVLRPGRPTRLLAGGILLGLAVAVKATAAVVVPFAAVAAIRGPYRLRALLRDGSWVVGGALGSVLAVSVAAGLGLGWVAGLTRSGDSVQWTSPATAVGMTIGYLGRPFGVRIDAVPVTRLVGLALLAVTVVVIWWRARRQARHQILFGAGLALAATVVLSPVFHPWYATWPLAVLAATSLRTTWFALPCLVASFLTLPDGSNLATFTKFPGAPLMVLLVVVVVVRALRRARNDRATSGLLSPSRERQGPVAER
jgi:hypothetical protein